MSKQQFDSLVATRIKATFTETVSDFGSTNVTRALTDVCNEVLQKFINFELHTLWDDGEELPNEFRYDMILRFRRLAPLISTLSDTLITNITKDRVHREETLANSYGMTEEQPINSSLTSIESPSNKAQSEANGERDLTETSPETVLASYRGMFEFENIVFKIEMILRSYVYEYTMMY